MANTLNLGSGNWGTKDGSLLGYNNENNNFKPLPFDFTRASSATRVNKQGLIETVASGVPRIDFTDANGALLLEPQRTNLVTYSIPISSSPYSYDGVGVGTAPIVTTNQGISQDGTQNATRIDFNLNGGTTSSDLSQMAYVGTSLIGDYTSSFYLKSFDNNSYTVTLLDTNGAATTETITPEWKRFTFYNGGGTTSANLIRIRLRGNENTSDTASLLAWGFQLEQSSYPTSYIPTQGSAVTRIVDACSQTPPSGIIGQTEGTLFIDVNITKLVDSEAIGTINSGGYANNVTMAKIDATIQFVRNSATQSAPSVVTSSAITTGRHKMAIAYKSGDTAFFLDGVQVSTTQTQTFTNGTLSILAITGDAVGAIPFSDSYNQAILFKTRLSNAELADLTTI